MGVNYTEVIERMRWAGRLKNDSAVARVVEVTPQALSNYKKKGEMPSHLVLKFADALGLSLDWLLTGKGEMHRPGGYEKTGRGLLTAKEAAKPYGTDGEAALRKEEMAAMSPDEMICVGKLLKILRGADKDNSMAIKNAIDALLKTSELPAAVNFE